MFFENLFLRITLLPVGLRSCESF